MRMSAKERFDRHCETCPQCDEQYSKSLMCAEGRKLLAALSIRPLAIVLGVALIALLAWFFYRFGWR